MDSETQNGQVANGSTMEPVPQPAPAPVVPPVQQAPAPQPVPPQQAPMPAQIDLSGNKVMAILAYLGILIIVPFLTGAKNDPFVKFHIKQGLALIILWIAAGVLSSVLSFISYASGFYAFSFIFPIIYLGLALLVVLGIVNAASGKMSPLPVIGGLGNRFNF